MITLDEFKPAKDAFFMGSPFAVTAKSHEEVLKVNAEVDGYWERALCPSCSNRVTTFFGGHVIDVNNYFECKCGCTGRIRELHNLKKEIK